jgi:hypothetical protein
MLLSFASAKTQTASKQFACWPSESLSAKVGCHQVFFGMLTRPAEKSQIPTDLEKRGWDITPQSPRFWYGLSRRQYRTMTGAACFLP